MDNLKARVLDTIKMLKSVKGDSLDEIITFAISKSIDDVLGYCHLDEFPTILESTLVLMSIDILNEGGFLLSNEESGDGRIKSIQEGDTTVSMVTEMEAYKIIASAPSFAKVYSNKLNSYRKMAR